MKTFPAVHSVCMRLLPALGFAIAASAPAFSDTTFVPGDTQFIAALGNSSATSGDEIGRAHV